MEQALIAAGSVVAVFVISAGTASFFAARAVLRRYRSVRQRVRAMGTSRLSSRGSALRAPTAVAVATVGSPRWWAVQGRRHEMWRAVTSAEHAVGVARRAGVAVGELPGLANELRRAASGVDALLRANDRSGSLSEEDRQECARIQAAAADIHHAATMSLRTVAHDDLGPVIAAIRIEAAALASGVRAARA